MPEENAAKVVSTELDKIISTLNDHISKHSTNIARLGRVSETLLSSETKGELNPEKQSYGEGKVADLKRICDRFSDLNDEANRHLNKIQEVI